MHFANSLSKLFGGFAFLAATAAHAEPGADPATAPITPGEVVDSSSPPTSVKGFFVDPVRGPTPFQPEYDRWFGDERRPSHYGRTALELGGVLAIGTTYYWIVSDPNKVDWDYVDLK